MATTLHTVRSNEAGDAGSPAPLPLLVRLAAEGAQPDQVAEAAVREWKQVHDALAPLIGQSGAAALYRRTLHLARADRPWLDPAFLGAVTPGDFSAYRDALARQDSAIAAGAHDETQRALRGLLINLIGPSLTERLLRAAAVSPSAGKAVQDLPR
ncbi:MAG: hypothetical protein V4787_15505 [Pseudomonadota bacterium]